MRFIHPLRALIVSFGLLFLCVGLSGCPDKKPKFPTCDKDKDCKEGQYCFNKTCSECRLDEHCQDYETCEAGACTLRPGKCESNDDCQDGQVCKDNECTACQSDGECGGDRRCSEGACLARGSCQSDNDCADEEDCVDGKCQVPGATGEAALTCDLPSVYFGFDQYSIAADQRENLTTASTCLTEGGDRGVYVEGHTDDQGTEEYNIALSEKRARSVADFLSRLGIDPDRLQIVPRGETGSYGAGESARAEERKVDFQWK